jgi:hypothetical protein
MGGAQAIGYSTGWGIMGTDPIVYTSYPLNASVLNAETTLLISP